MIIELPISKEQIDRAEIRRPHGITSLTVSNGRYQLYSYVAEILFLDHFKTKYTLTDPPTEQEAYHWDFKVNGIKVDVKMRRWINMPPFPTEYASILSYKRNQYPHIFYFVQISAQMERGWLLGGINRAEFWNNSEAVGLGDTDHNGFQYYKPSNRIYINKLKPLSEFVKR